MPDTKTETMPDTESQFIQSTEPMTAEYFCPKCNVWICRNEITEKFHADYQVQLCKSCNSEVFHQFDIRAPQIDISLETLQESKLEIPEDELVALISKVENLPRSQQRTIVRELIDRLGKDLIADLLD